MRTFQLIFLLIFLVVFLLLLLGSYRNMKIIVPGKLNKVFKLFYIIFHVSLFISFIFLYIYPNQPREASNYTIYLKFNFILFTLFIFTIPNSLSYLLQISLFRKKEPVVPYMGFLISLSIVFIMIYGTFIGTRQLKTEQVELTFSNLPERFDGYKIFLFADTHLGGIIYPDPLFRKAERVMQATSPDLILFAGDLVNNFADEADDFESYFKLLLHGKQGFSILGNHDYGDYSDWESNAKKAANFKAILDANKNLGFKLLRNEHLKISRGADTIYLAGVENWGHPPFPQYAELDEAIQNIPHGAFTILMTHDPAHWESKVKKKENIALTLSGHTHGMQWGIKIAGIPFSLARLTRKYWGGLYRTGNSALYVNAGFGTVGVPWRVDMPAEITILTLKRSKVNGE